MVNNCPHHTHIVKIVQYLNAITKTPSVGSGTNNIKFRNLNFRLKLAIYAKFYGENLIPAAKNQGSILLAH